MLPAHLPTSADPFAVIDAERTAMERRLDVQVAKLDAESLGEGAGLTRATRFVNVLEVGYTTIGDRRSAAERLRDRARIAALRLERMRSRALSPLRRAMARTAEIAVHARSEVREAYAGIARRSISPGTIATRSCRCASGSRMSNCCVTTAC